ncbi:MAG: hypothetical protein Q9170_005957 [Blastenia crenularia]
MYSTSSAKETQEISTGKASFSTQTNSPAKNDRHMTILNDWLNESTTDAPWVHELITNIHVRPQSRSLYIKDTIEELSACLELGVPRKILRSHQDQPPRLLAPVPEEAIPPSLSDGLSHDEEDQTAAAVFGILASRVAQILHFSEPTDGQGHNQAAGSQSARTPGTEPYIERDKSNRGAPTGNRGSDTQDDLQKEIPAPKRLKVARPPTTANGRSFACLFFKQNPRNCQKTHCAGCSTHNVETVIRRKYNMSIPGQDEQLWIASYMALFCVSRSDVPSPFVSSDVEDLSTALASRLEKQPAFATGLVEFIDEHAAMRHRHEEGREELRRHYESIEAQRVEKVKVETRAELTIAMEEYEDVCKHERDSLKANFEASLSANDSSKATENINGAVTSTDNGNQEQLWNTAIGNSTLQRHLDIPPMNFNIDFSDSGYSSNGPSCLCCGNMFYIDSEGFCQACRTLQEP